jgi:hypothetical protein
MTRGLGAPGKKPRFFARRITTGTPAKTTLFAGRRENHVGQFC